MDKGWRDLGFLPKPGADALRAVLKGAQEVTIITWSLHHGTDEN
jgi:hypothetical protein